MNPIIYQSDVMRQLLQRADRYAATDLTVLIQGESGTGKELIARFLHENSPRAKAPFVPVNCAAIADSLVDSTLFGYEKGAFTGADALRPGCFEAAGNGTLFLDEIGELPLHVQSRLLRVLEQNEFHRVGSFTPVKSEARIIAATNRDLNQAVADQEFRQDLFFRLESLTLRLPALRDRCDDILPIAEHFLSKCAVVPGRQFRLSDSAAQQLTAYHWPGNVRQLRNILLRSQLDHDNQSDLIDDLSIEDIPPTAAPLSIFRDESVESLRGHSIREIEELVVRDRLKLCHENRSQAAESLGIHVRTLRNKLTEYQDRDAA